MKKLTNSGFSAVEALLVVVLLGILGFTGFYVYHAQNNANKTLDTTDKTAASQTQTIKKSSTTKATPKTSTTTVSTKTTPEHPEYVEIAEWRVRALQPVGQTLQYSFSKVDGSTSNSDVFAGFSSNALVSLDSDCSAEASAGGSIGRFLATDQYNDTTAGAYAAAADPSTFAHIGQYYYIFGHAQAACGAGSSQADALQGTVNKDVATLVSQLQAY